MIPDALKDVLTSDPEYLSGAIRFVGTRVPLQALLDSQLHGESIDSFLAGYPGVRREQVEAVLEWESLQVRSAFGIGLAS